MFWLTWPPEVQAAFLTLVGLVLKVILDRLGIKVPVLNQFEAAQGGARPAAAAPVAHAQGSPESGSIANKMVERLEQAWKGHQEKAADEFLQKIVPKA